MSSLSDTLKSLSAMRHHGHTGMGATDQATVLQMSSTTGSNPGNLEHHAFIPPDLGPGRPLVVVLHGCTQTAEAYERGAGWTQLAVRNRFAVLYPQQGRANNPNLCFNWFDPSDTKRDGGEAASIAQMIDHMVTAHELDRTQIYITGLSAGGAMASVMLARYPETFAGGAMIAGLPFGVAASIPQALDRMRGNGLPAKETLAALARDASPHAGPWPTISVWQGEADTVVAPANAQAIVDQWLPLHGINDGQKAIPSMIDGHQRRRWADGSGRIAVEWHSIAGLGHGTPIDTRGPDPLGKAGPHMLEAGTASTRRIAQFWGIAPMTDEGVKDAAVSAPRGPEAEAHAPVMPLRPSAIDVQSVIDTALRRAGIKR